MNGKISDGELVLFQGMQGRKGQEWIAGHADGAPHKRDKGRVPVAVHTGAGDDRAGAKVLGDRPADLLKGQGMVWADDAGGAGGGGCCWDVRKVHSSAVGVEERDKDAQQGWGAMQCMWA